MSFGREERFARDRGSPKRVKRVSGVPVKCGFAAITAEHLTSLCGKAAKLHCERSEQLHLPAGQTSPFINAVVKRENGFGVIGTVHRGDGEYDDTVVIGELYGPRAVKRQLELEEIREFVEPVSVFVVRV